MDDIPESGQQDWNLREQKGKAALLQKLKLKQELEIERAHRIITALMCLL